MNHIKAIGFDLFNTLLTVEITALDEAVPRLISSLEQNGFVLEHESFKRAHQDAAVRFLEDARRDGKETHNRFWISAALEHQKHKVQPDDPRIAAAVDAYFSAFIECSHLIPGTLEILSTLQRFYPLGLLSNFTHGPAAREIIRRLGLTPFFDVVLISGEIGFRKPHPLVFQRLIDQLGVEGDHILYVGDDVEPDIIGARSAGLQPIWFTYVRDQGIPPAPGIYPKGTQEPESEVPRISSWNELLSLVRPGAVLHRNRASDIES